MLTNEDYIKCGLSLQEVAGLKLLGCEIVHRVDDDNRPYAMNLHGRRIASFLYINNMWDVIPNDDYFKHKAIIKSILGVGRAF